MSHSFDGTLTANQAYHFMHTPSLIVDWSIIVWRPCIPPSHSSIFWRIMHKKMLTDETFEYVLSRGGQAFMNRPKIEEPDLPKHSRTVLIGLCVFSVA